MSPVNAERWRLQQCREGIPWRKWGPYLSERQWGTVREDYSENGDAWSYFTHDQARSRAYRWGEDGIAGISDDRQLLCFALALWNGRDAILKERLFGLTNQEGNHGEDAKEYYFYLDSTPTHSYMRHLYKYPQSAYPYDDLVRTNGSRGRLDPEYELLDTHVFDEDRYFDVFTEYAKEDPEDIAIVITIVNRGAAPAQLHVLPTLWFRNTWWNAQDGGRPNLWVLRDHAADGTVLAAVHPVLGERYLYCESGGSPLFCDNETNTAKLSGTENRSRWTKDGVNDFLIHGHREAINAARTGTKASVHYHLTLQAHARCRLRLRLTNRVFAPGTGWLDSLDGVVQGRRQQADEFYSQLAPHCDAEQLSVLRQALSGMLWSKQFYSFDVERWLMERATVPTAGGRNAQWRHLCNEQIISMPDKWEYPWYASWDLAFHTLALTMVDRQFAEEQLELVLRPVYLHPNGQIPAYEWNFSDVNPPVHAWALLFMHTVGKLRGEPLDHDYLRLAFHRLLQNFTWWVNRKDPAGRNVFEGGFLGLDNIGVFDRSAPLPGGGVLEQADGTGWMVFYSQTMMALALELALRDALYEDMAAKFLEHFLWISSAMDLQGSSVTGLWDEEDGFFYDVLRLPNGEATRLKTRSIVGLLPLCAVLTLESDTLKRFPTLLSRARAFLERHPTLTKRIASVERRGVRGRHLLAIVDETKLRRILARVLDEQQFLSDFGIRSLSREHLERPFSLDACGQRHVVKYLPAESDSGMFGGNSNWRGPIWFPFNLLLIRALLELYRYYGDELTIECPTGSGRMLTLFEVAMDLCRRLNAIFERDASGRRPVYGGTEKFQSDPHWRDYLLFYEYFHGDNGAGIGASHQTGWTGLVARTIQLYSTLSAKDVLSFTR